jgi:hypothetical protein
MTQLTCEAPVPGGCSLPARALIAARPSEDMVGNGLALWQVHLRCDGPHTAREAAASIRAADPAGVVMAFTTQTPEPLQDAAYSAYLA